MSELELLFLVLALIYAWECTCWFRRGSVAVLTWLGRRWHTVHPGALLGNQHGGIVLANPLPPLGGIVSGNQYPLSLAPDAILVWVSTGVNPGWRPPQSGRFFRFDQIQTVEARGRNLRINGQTVLRGSSPLFAHHLAQQLLGLQKTDPAARAKAIEKIFRDAFDTKAIEQRWKEHRRRTRVIQWLVNALFLYVFAAVPFLIHYAGLKRTWMGLLVGLLALTSSTAFLFRRAHKASHPDAKDERFTHFLTILLSPATAIRTHDILSRTLLEVFHPLAIARVFCPREAFQRFAATVVREIHFPPLPLAPAADAGAEAVERFSRAALQKSVEVFLIRNGIHPDELLRPPARADETCQSYCPRCGQQFTTASGKCSDCGGRELVKFDGSKA